MSKGKPAIKKSQSNQLSRAIRARKLEAARMIADGYKSTKQNKGDK